jgi:hypothetical protein
MSHHINDRGQLVVEDRDRPRQVPTLRNIREGLLLAFYVNPPTSQWTNEARWLQEYLLLPLGEDAGARRKRLQAALDSMDCDPTLIQTIQHYVRERFSGEWTPGTLTAVHRWLVAEHSLTPEEAWEVTAPKLLALLVDGRRRTQGGEKKTRNRRQNTAELLLDQLREDRRLLDWKITELAEHLKKNPGTISRAINKSKLAAEIQEEYRKHSKTPPTIRDI